MNVEILEVIYLIVRERFFKDFKVDVDRGIFICVVIGFFGKVSVKY